MSKIFKFHTYFLICFLLSGTAFLSDKKHFELNCKPSLNLRERYSAFDATFFMLIFSAIFRDIVRSNQLFLDCLILDTLF